MCRLNHNENLCRFLRWCELPERSLFRPDGSGGFVLYVKCLGMLGMLQELKSSTACEIYRKIASESNELCSVADRPTAVFSATFRSGSLAKSLQSLERQRIKLSRWP